MQNKKAFKDRHRTAANELIKILELDASPKTLIEKMAGKKFKKIPIKSTPKKKKKKSKTISPSKGKGVRRKIKKNKITPVKKSPNIKRSIRKDHKRDFMTIYSNETISPWSTNYINSLSDKYRLPFKPETLFSNSDIQNLGRRGGVKFFSGDIYGYIQFLGHEHLKQITKKAVNYMEYSKRKTLSGIDVIYALKQMKIPVYGV